MDEPSPEEATFPVPPAALAVLLSGPSRDAETRTVGHGTGVALARQIRESARNASPSWTSIADEWWRSGLGRLSWSVPGPGLLELAIDSATLPADAPDFVIGLLEGLIGSFASEPVGVARRGEPEFVDGSGTEVRLQFVVGAPELIARLRPRLDSGQSIPELMEEVWN